MGRGRLSIDELEQLKKSPHVLGAEEHRIVYSTDFKLHFMKEYLNGKGPTQIFREAGLDPAILGSKRIERATSRWKESYAAGKLDGVAHLKTADPATSRRVREKEVVARKLERKDQKIQKQQEQHHQKLDALDRKRKGQISRKQGEIDQLHQKRQQDLYRNYDKIEALNQKHQKQLAKKQSEIDELKAQVEALKKAGSLGRRRCDNKVYGRIDLCIMVEKLSNDSGKACPITTLCKVLGLARSTYYHYLSSKDIREKREEKDLEALFFIEKIFNSKKQRCKGSRSIKDTLELDYDIIYSRKKIQRIMRKFHLICPVKTSNPYRRLWKATKEDKIAPNLLNREFKPGQARKVLLTDITYIKHQGQFSYLSVILDSQTGEPLSYKLSKDLKVDFAIETLKNLPTAEFAEGIMLHSDQGVHYSSKAFRMQLKKMNIIQSMSRRGNCHDNAPMESFFGHMKAELNIDSDWTFEQLQSEINEYMYDYRYHRRRRNLNRMTPYEYGTTLVSKVA